MDHPVLALNMTILSIVIKEAFHFYLQSEKLKDVGPDYKKSRKRVGSGLMKGNVEKGIF